jgi:hypothetical protein
MSDERKYVRVYYSIIDDDRFKHVYSDNAALAAWLRMLLDADALWPASASLPSSLPKRVLRILTDSGLIEVSGARFRVHGLDAERQRRSDAGRAGGRASARSRASTVEEQPFNERSTNVQRSVQRNSNLAETSRDEQSKDEQNDARADLDAFVAVRFRIPTPRQRTFMDAYCRTFDETGPERAARLIWANPDDPIGAMKGDLQAFREERRAEAVASEVPKALRRRKPSGFTGVNAEIAKALREVDAKREGNGMAPLSELLPDAFAASRGGKP